MRWDDVVTDPAVIARLSHAGPTRVEFHWFIFGWMWDAARRRNWRTLRHYLWVSRMRMANCESIRLGPLCIHRPMPWLLGPARQLHPEAFTPRDLAGTGEGS